MASTDAKTGQKRKRSDDDVSIEETCDEDFKIKVNAIETIAIAEDDVENVDESTEHECIDITDNETSADSDEDVIEVEEDEEEDEVIEVEESEEEECDEWDRDCKIVKASFEIEQLTGCEYELHCFGNVEVIIVFAFSSFNADVFTRECVCGEGIRCSYE